MDAYDSGRTDRERRGNINQVILLLFVFAFTIHNLEESVWLIRQQPFNNRKVKLHPKVSQDEFLFGLFWVTSLAYLTTALYIFYPEVSLFKYAYFGFVGSIMLNIIFPHLFLTLVERYYSPGLLTGIVAVLPINSLIVKAGIDLGVITISQWIVSTLVVGGILILSIPISFKIGKRLITF